MSYLYINSSYRNRILYPNQADFIIPFQTIHSLESNLNVFNTFNPITVFPLYVFNWTNYLSTDPFIYTTTIQGGSSTVIQVDSSIFENLLGLTTTISNFYVYQKIENTYKTLKSFIVKINGNYSRIINYSPFYNSIQIENALSFNVGDTLEIINDIKIINNSLEYESAIIINGEMNELSFKNKMLLYNVDLNEKRIGSYNTDLNIFETETPFSSSIQPTDKYMLFENQNLFILGNLVLFSNNKYFIESFIGNYSIIEKGLGYSIGQKVYLTVNETDTYSVDNSLFIITKVGLQGEILEMEIHEIGSQHFSNSRIYSIKPYDLSCFKLGKLLINSINTIFKYKIKNTQNLNYYSRDFIGNYFQCILLSPLYTIYQDKIYLSPNHTLPTLLEEQPNDLYYYQVKNGVFGIHKVFFIDKENVFIFVEKVNPLLLYRFQLYQEQIEPLTNLPNEFKGCFNGLVYPFLNEGIVPLNFAGTYLTQSVMSCYEMTVLSLILPNVPVQSLNSFITSGLPFVLLEIQNVSMPSSYNKNSIISNNPYASNSTFVCPLSDISSPLISKFIKINSAGMVQVIKFTPADNLRIRVLLPNGNLFKTQELDNSPPAPFNPLLQLGFLIELKKL
jgi:hypothetical protein